MNPISIPTFFCFAIAITITACSKPDDTRAMAAHAAAADAGGSPRIVHFKCPKGGDAQIVRAGCLCSTDSTIYSDACGKPGDFRNVEPEPGGCAFTCD